MQAGAREDHHRALFRDDPLAHGDRLLDAAALERIVDQQLSAVEGAWLAMEEADVGKLTPGKVRVRVVIVGAEVVAVIAGGELRFHAGDVEIRMPERAQNPAQMKDDAVNDQRMEGAGVEGY